MIPAFRARVVALLSKAWRVISNDPRGNKEEGFCQIGASFLILLTKMERETRNEQS